MIYSKEMLEEMIDSDGNLDLRGTNITSLPEGLTVGGWLYLSGTNITNAGYKKLKNGDVDPQRYIYADDILTHIKKIKKLDKYTYYVGKISNKNVVFDGDNYAHCTCFNEGVADLEFKKAKERGADQFKKYNLDSIVSKDEAISMYRIITGACKAGTAQFLSEFKELKDEYSIREILELTKGRYGSEVFKRFFEN